MLEHCTLIQTGSVSFNLKHPSRYEAYTINKKVTRRVAPGLKTPLWWQVQTSIGRWSNWPRYVQLVLPFYVTYSFTFSLSLSFYHSIYLVVHCSLTLYSLCVPCPAYLSLCFNKKHNGPSRLSICHQRAVHKR